MNTNLLTRYIVKQATTPDPRITAAVRGGLVGAGVGGLTQMLRSMFQSRRDEEENGSPSIMKGMLMGGLGGAGLNAAAMHYGPQINSWAEDFLDTRDPATTGDVASLQEAGGLGPSMGIDKPKHNMEAYHSAIPGAGSMADGMGPTLASLMR